jgi:DNA topoisomerase I
MGVVTLLEKHFHNFLDYKYTARLEDDLDAISRGESASLDYLKTFYHGDLSEADSPGLRSLVDHGEKEIDPRIINGLPLGEVDGKHLEVRIGRYGPFISDGERRCSVPDEMPPDELTLDKAMDMLENASREPESLGLHPDSGEPIFLKVGRYGPYVQLGDGRNDSKPKMASLVPGTTLEDVDLAHAVKLLQLPKNLGPHPETGEKVVAANGRFGPYVQSGEETRSLPGDISPIDVTLEQAVEILKQPRRGARATAKQAPLKVFGMHPQTGKEVKLLSGRYGPYVSDGETHASLARGVDPMQITPEQANQMILDRIQQIADQGGVVKKAGGRKAPARKAAAPKKAAKKAAKKATKQPVEQ